ncbi:hypothetical protein [Lachnospira multipara]|nr:hypothetical protein [Lachnospira multipara]
MNSKIKRISTKMLSTVTSITTMATMTGLSVVCAADATALISWGIKIMATIATILGAFYTVQGVISYAAANSEGDGPAKNKAIQQIASGAMLVIVSVLINSFSGSLVSMITAA